MCCALPISDDGRVCIERLHTIPIELWVLDLAVYLYILYRESYRERLRLSARLMSPWHSGYVIWWSILGCRRVKWVYHLSNGIFCWLPSILSEYLIFCQGEICTIEPYLLGRFAHQFGYGQFYLGNPNINLHFSGNLFEGAWAWYFHMAGGTGGMFNFPQWLPNAYASLNFCTWYGIANIVLGYKMNLSCIKAIKSTYSAYRGSKTTRKKGMNEYLEAEKEAGAHEATVSIIETTEEHSARRSRQAVAKRSHSSLSAGGSSWKKTRRELIVHIFCILFITFLHLSCNKSANFLVLNVYFAEDNHIEKDN